MNIDLKARLRNKGFWIYMISAIVTITQLLGLKIFPENWAEIVNMVLGVFMMLGIIVDNSTEGLSDNKGVE